MLRLGPGMCEHTSRAILEAGLHHIMVVCCSLNVHCLVVFLSSAVGGVETEGDAREK